MSHIENTHTTMPLSRLIADFDEKRLTIPPHQREYRWDQPRKEKFIKSIHNGYPIPSILLSKRPSDAYPTLEDGQQRITTASKYRRNEFLVDGKRYSDLSEIERERFDKHHIAVIQFSNASDTDRIQIFDWHQNGAPLTPGERYHAHYNTPLVHFVKEQLMTPGVGYHDRAAEIWGIRGDPSPMPDGYISQDKRRKWLLSNVALVLGLTFGSANATKNWSPERGFLTDPFPPAKQEAVKKDLERIFEIYEESARKYPVPARAVKKWQNYCWEFGNFTGYIMYSLSIAAREAYEASVADTAFEDRASFEETMYEPNSLENYPDEWRRLKDGWSDFIAGVRRKLTENPNKKLKSILHETIHAGMSKARNWNNERWKNGYNRVFGIADEEEYSEDEDSSSSSESDD